MDPPAVDRRRAPGYGRGVRADDAAAARRRLRTGHQSVDRRPARGLRDARCRRSAYAGPLLHVRRSEEHTSELQSLAYLVCRILLEKTTARGPLASQTRPMSTTTVRPDSFPVLRT